jgi:catechol 2,3-dioxygenase-like lactoylglutathione lyase family enzyme
VPELARFARARRPAITVHGCSAIALPARGRSSGRQFVGYVPPMPVRRIVAYAGGDDVAASRDFYVEVLGMRVAMEVPVLDLQSPDDPAAEVIIGAQEMQDPQPSFGVDVGEPAAVDAAHAEAVKRGLRVVYPLTDEPWGVRRFFVEDPGGTILNVLAHIT